MEDLFFWTGAIVWGGVAALCALIAVASLIDHLFPRRQVWK